MHAVVPGATACSIVLREQEEIHAGVDDCLQELATGEFVRRRENLVFVGKSGLGKSCLIQGMGRRLCALGYRVRYITSADLLEDLTAASGDKTLPARVRCYSRFELLIIDEFGFDKLERRE